MHPFPEFQSHARVQLRRAPRLAFRAPVDFRLGLAVLKPFAISARACRSISAGGASNTLATLTLARVTHLTLFEVTGGILVGGLTAFWTVVALGTAHGAWRGYLFVAPCLQGGNTTARFEADVV